MRLGLLFIALCLSVAPCQVVNAEDDCGSDFTKKEETVDCAHCKAGKAQVIECTCSKPAASDGTPGCDDGKQFEAFFKAEGNSASSHEDQGKSMGDAYNSYINLRTTAMQSASSVYKKSRRQMAVKSSKRLGEAEQNQAGGVQPNLLLAGTKTNLLGDALEKSKTTYYSASNAPNGKLPEWRTPNCHIDAFTAPGMSIAEGLLAKKFEARVKQRIDWGKCVDDLKVVVSNAEKSANQKPVPAKCTDKAKAAGDCATGDQNERTHDEQWKPDAANTVNFLWSRVPFTNDQRDINGAQMVLMNLKVSACADSKHETARHMGRMIMVKLTLGQDPLIAGWAAVPPIVQHGTAPQNVCTPERAMGIDPNCKRKQGCQKGWCSVCNLKRTDGQPVCSNAHYEFYTNAEGIIREAFSDFRFDVIDRQIKDKQSAFYKPTTQPSATCKPPSSKSTATARRRKRKKRV